MSSLLRTSLRVSRTRPFSPILSAVPRRFASSDYGSDQGGQEQGTNQKNPMKHMEHPGPESPAAQGKSGSSSSSSSGSGSSSSSESMSGSDSSSTASKGGAQPKITQGGPADKEQSEDVKQHNKEMENRADKPANQINDKGDSKVGKEFWKGHVGDVGGEKE